MNAKLKRMFEDPDCSMEEAKLHAAMLGKSYAECKEEWEREYKKEFVLDNTNILVSHSKDFGHGADGMVHYKVATHYYDDVFGSKISRCHNVEIPPLEQPFAQVGTMGAMTTMVGGMSAMPMYITVSFYECELDKVFLAKLNEKLIEMRRGINI